MRARNMGMYLQGLAEGNEGDPSVTMSDDEMFDLYEVVYRDVPGAPAASGLTASQISSALGPLFDAAGRYVTSVETRKTLAQITPTIIILGLAFIFAMKK